MFMRVIVYLAMLAVVHRQLSSLELIPQLHLAQARHDFVLDDP